MNYWGATICEKGHVLSQDEINVSKFCTICGSKTLSICPSCSASIRGERKFDMVVLGHISYDLKYYCHECGNPYPWTIKVLENATELLTLEDNIDDETKSIILNAIPDLIVESLDSPLAVARFRKYSRNLSDITKNLLMGILANVISAKILQMINS